MLVLYFTYLNCFYSNRFKLKVKQKILKITTSLAVYTV